jgi:CheY-like chemotaxis protein
MPEASQLWQSPSAGEARLRAIPASVALLDCRHRQVDRALEGGAAGLLPKPIDFAALRAEVDRRLAPPERAGP